MNLVPGHVAGAVCGLVASAATAAYLSSIEIDDGLELLIYMPIMAGCAAVAALMLGVAGVRFGDAVLPIAVASPVVPGGLWLAITRSPLQAGSVVGVVVMSVLCAAVGALAGWPVGAVVRRLVRGSTV
ncbi:MAG TPA: hypothetical protein VFY82_00250 [Acidimicrobiales bacterium]|nr:hypothetical protein [Acidimicrobiales bacterium]